MAFFACDRMGATIDAPSPPAMHDLLATLHGVVDPEHPDVSVTHESGWSISAFASGLIVLENVETGAGPWHMRDVPADRIVDYWGAIAEGRYDDLKPLPWRPGYGG